MDIYILIENMNILLLPSAVWSVWAQFITYDGAIHYF